MQYPQHPGPYGSGPEGISDPAGRYGVSMPPGFIGMPGYGAMPGYVQPDTAAYGSDLSMTLARDIERNLGLGSNTQQQTLGTAGQQYAPRGSQGYPAAPYQQQQRGYPPPPRPHHALGHQQHEYPPQYDSLRPGGPATGMVGGPPGVQRQQAGHQFPPHPGQQGPNHMRPNSGYPAGPQQGPRGGRGGRLQGNNRLGGPQQHQQGGQRGGRKVPRGLEDNVKRTVYISYIDQQVTEESLANFFADCGTVMDCRICGDPNSAMRFAFIEFLEIEGAQQALHKTGQHLGTSQLRVLPSKTAIVPVNKELMPRSHEELERCSRTVYVANIDKALGKDDVRNFFEELCGTIGKIRLLGDLAHSTRIAFIEFIQAESAMAALNCSGALLGSLPLRVSPSKTPVRGDKEEKEAQRQQQRRRQRQQQQQEVQQEGDDGQEQQEEEEEGGATAVVAEAPAAAESVSASSEQGDEDATAGDTADAAPGIAVAEGEASALPDTAAAAAADGGDGDGGQAGSDGKAAAGDESLTAIAAEKGTEEGKAAEEAVGVVKAPEPAAAVPPPAAAAAGESA